MSDSRSELRKLEVLMERSNLRRMLKERLRDFGGDTVEARAAVDVLLDILGAYDPAHPDHRLYRLVMHWMFADRALDVQRRLGGDHRGG